MPNGEDDRIRIRIDPELARRDFVDERDPAAAFEAARAQPSLESLDLEDFGIKIDIPKAAIQKVLSQRIDAAAQVYDTLGGIKKDLVEFFPKVPEILPAFLDATLVNADGTAASLVSVSVSKPDFGDAASNATPWSNPESMTDMRGAFRVKLPPRPVPEQGLKILVRGSDRTVDVQIKRADLVTSSGSLGVIPLQQTLKPLPPRSIISRLRDVVIPKSEEDVVAHPEDFAEPAPAFSMGEGDCARWFRSNSGVIDRFGFSLLVRLIAPELSGRRLGSRVKVGDRSVLLSSSSTGLTKYLPATDLVDAMTTLGSWELVQRVPVEEPIDITAFRNVIEANPKLMPKASTLGIGYIVRMHQIWIPTGLSLGDLVYSLPLAPGEQQRIAVAEERETLSVREAEALSAEEQQRYREAADSSTAAVFTSAFNEAASGGSTMKTSSEAGAFGGGLGVGGFFSGIVAGLGIGGGYSDSTTTGSTSSWQKASRDYVSNATQDFHSQLARQASARRSANRTSVRLASASERREVVSKVISNHNHCHALTMQYWEVLRHFGVSTKVDDVQLVCFVPLEIVQFLPSGQSRTLLSGDYTRNQLLTRYAMLLRYFDVLERRLWWRAEMMHGLKILRTFAGNPKMGVAPSNAPAQEIVNVSFRGTFMPFEDIYVTAVSNTGSRVGPVRMVGASAAIASGIETRAGLIESLRSRRRTTFETRTAGLALPEYIARSDIARLEFSRSFSTFSYRLTLPGALNFTDIIGYLQNTNSLDVTLSPADLEREIGGPLVQDPTATLNGNVDLLEPYNGIGGTEQMGAVLPVAAKRLAPLLSYADLLRIEAVFHHVVTNTVTYSRAVWESLTAEERAILLERFTVGVPSGGVIDASQEVPLLNCVANQVLGYFGNCAIMPFFIPVLLAEEMKVTSRDIQEALLKFHRQAFVPPQSSITLPTRGVLGEAILGSCCACEKIDLTRFWNWQDSPGDTAAEPGSLAQLFSGGNQLVGPAGATAPSQLTTGPMVTINQGPVALTPADLAKTLIEKMPSTNLPQNLTGMAELGAQMKVQTTTTADSLNKTISEASGLAKAAMEALPKAMQAKAGTGAGGAGAGGAGAGGAGAGGAGAGGAGAGGAGGGAGGGDAGAGGAGGAGGGAGGAGGAGGGAGGGDVLAAIDGGAAPVIV